MRPLALLALLLAWGAPVVVLASDQDPSRAGAYCPFPKKGEVPECFAPVEKEYSGFFDAVEAGELDAAEVTNLEARLRSGDADEATFLAISSLAYGYFQLAERAASAEKPDPALVARLESWNVLLTSAYEGAESRPALRTAVRDAALDLHERAPAVVTECEPGADRESCDTTGLLLQTLRRIDDPAGERGVRGALGRLLGRIIDDEDEAK